MKDRRFKITLKVKPYVWQYLVNHFQDQKIPEVGLVNLRNDSELNLVLKKILCKKRTQYDKRYDSSSRYSQEVKIIISQDDFTRYGWEMSPTDCVQFGLIIERRAKHELYTYINLYSSMGGTIQEAILSAQQVLNYPEDMWPADSIRRGFSRNRPESLNLKDLIASEFNKIFTGNLSY